MWTMSQTRNSISMPRLRLWLNLFLFLLIPLNVYGMTVDELPITGTIQDREAVNEYLAYYPSSVALLYTQRGGRVVVIPCQRIDSTARRYGCYDSGVVGLYVFQSRKIYLADTEDMAVHLAHELGHFLYEETRPSWSQADKERWTDSEEFAVHYSRRDADFTDIERSAERLIQ